MASVTHVGAARLAPAVSASTRPSRSRGVPVVKARTFAPQTPFLAQRHSTPFVAKSSSADTVASENQQQETAEPASASAQRYSVSISKPLGLVLEEEGKTGRIYVAEVVFEGNAEKTGVISAGDTLISTSGYVYTTEKEYNEIMVRGGEKLVTMNVSGESFDTVMAAIGSHPGHIKVNLEFERPNSFKTL